MSIGRKTTQKVRSKTEGTENRPGLEAGRPITVFRKGIFRKCLYNISEEGTLVRIVTSKAMEGIQMWTLLRDDQGDWSCLLKAGKLQLCHQVLPTVREVEELMTHKFTMVTWHAQLEDLE